jgi:protein-tyrosine phosphatase
MAERLLAKHLGDCDVDSASAGTGTWHVGETMQPGAARTLRERGASAEAFQARHLTRSMVEEADLVLCATWEQVRFVLQLSPTAGPRTFVLGEFGRLMRTLALTDPRGLVEAVDAARAGAPSRPSDDLDDPYGRPDREFARVADEIEQTVIPLAEALRNGR